MTRHNPHVDPDFKPNGTTAPNPRLYANFGQGVALNYCTDGRDSVVELTIEVFGPFGKETRQLGIGTARRRRKDKFDDELGHMLSLGRAFKDALTRIETALPQGYKL